MARIDAKNIDETILNAFKNEVIQKHGKLRDAYGIEIQKALVMYLEANTKNRDSKDEYTRTHTIQEDSGSDGQTTKSKSQYSQKLTYISKQMNEMGAWDTQDFQRGIAARLIKDTCGGDPRTIQKYESDLRTMWELGL